MSGDVVLLVDDAPASLGALCSELEAEGYTVLVAPDGESALSQLDLVVPDAILLDALMPGLDGFETCRPGGAALRPAQPVAAHPAGAAPGLYARPAGAPP